MLQIQLLRGQNKFKKLCFIFPYDEIFKLNKAFLFKAIDIFEDDSKLLCRNDFFIQVRT